MFYNDRPFLRVGLPFLTAVLIGTVLLADIRKSRYERGPKVPRTEVEKKEVKRNIKTLEEELKEWEGKHWKRIKESDYEMKPVR